MSAQRAPRTRPAISAVNPAISPETAPTLHLRELDVAVSQVAVVVDPRSATSARRLVTLPVTAPRLATEVNKVVASVETKADTVAVVVDLVVVKEDKPATHAVVTATCLATAPKAKSVTTAVRSDIFPEIAHPRPAASAPAINANNLVTSRHNAQTRPTSTTIHTLRST